LLIAHGSVLITGTVVGLVAVLLPLKRFSRQPPQKVCCNFSNIEQIFPGAAALGVGARLVSR